MATSPTYTPGGISHARKRPSLATNLSTSSKKRKPSSFTAGPSHLRQTSFPPDGPDDSSLVFSRSPSVDSSVAQTPGAMSAVDGEGRKPRKRKRGSKAAGDVESVSGSVSGRGTGRDKGSVTGTAAGSLVNGQAPELDPDADGDEDDGDEAEESAMVEGGKMDEAAMRQQKENLALLVSAFTHDQAERYDMWRRVKLKKESVRRLVNHTLSQSVPASIITSVSGMTKVFIGELIERARDVQLEWMAAAEKLPTGEQLDADAPLRDRIQERDRGPLTPDHLREALRRYKKDRDGGAAGFMGLSLQGVVYAAPKMGGRRLFR